MAGLVNKYSVCSIFAIDISMYEDTCFIFSILLKSEIIRCVFSFVYYLSLHIRRWVQ
jgi:hypothetical protein